MLPYFAFLRAGFTMPKAVTSIRGGLLHHHFTLTPGLARGGIFSVALSVASQHLAVSQRSALRSSDFPLELTSDCPANSLNY